MKFEYKKEVSKVLDYILFPAIYHFIEEQRQSEDEILEQVISEDYMNFVEKMKNALEPYKDEIKKYYGFDIYSEYDFSNILIHGFPIYDYEDEHEYLKDLMEVEESKLRETLIKTLITTDDEDKSTITLEEDKLTEANAMRYINNLKIDSSNKWNLLMMIQQPKEYLKGFITLLEQLQSHYYKYYEEKADEAEKYGVELAKRLSKNTEETFKEITYNSIQYNFEDSDSCNLYVSTVFPYSLRFVNDETYRIVWGMRMEQSFKKLHEIREDKLSERVKIFKALGDKTRYESLKLLANGISSIKEIAQTLDVSSATISYHVNEFLTSGIISIKFDQGKKTGYKVDYEKLNEVIAEFKIDLNFTK